MLNENLSINVTPGGVPVVIHISQYDVGLRTFVFTPYTSHGTFTPDAAVAATLEGTKPDGNIVVQNCQYNATTGEITYTVQEQLAAVVGKVWSKLTLRDTNDNAIGYAAIIWAVDMAGVQDGAIASDSDISALAEFINEFGTINAYKAALDGALAAVGGPYVASTVSQMTDHSKVYVYTGSETGYTAGHWYYWNGSAWTDGGVYQASAVETDTTLTVAGMAADAKATGDAVAELENDLYVLEESVIDSTSIPDLEWEKGDLSTSEGQYVNTQVAIYTPRYYPISENAKMIFSGATENRYYYAYFYDEEKSFIPPRTNTLIPPANARYVRFVYGFTPASGITVESYGGVNAVAADWELSSKSAVQVQIDNNAADIANNVDDVYTFIGNKRITDWHSGYINTNTSVIDVTTVSSASWRHAIIACVPNDKFTLNLRGGSDPKPWCFVDSNYNRLTYGLTAEELSDTLIVAPANTAFLILNDTLRTGVCYYGEIYQTATDRKIDAIKYTGNICPIATATRTSNGVTYTPIGNGGYKAQGTATASSYYLIYNSTNLLPDGMKAGGTYYADFTTDNLGARMQVMYHDGTSNQVFATIDHSQLFTIPDNAVGLVIRLYVGNGVVVDSVLHPRIYDVGTIEYARLHRDKKTRPMLSIIYDDGVNDFKTYVMPIIAAKKVPIATAVVPEAIGVVAAIMPWEDVIDCYNNGAEVLTHFNAYTDTEWNNFGTQDISYRYLQSKNQICAHGIHTPNVLVFSGASSRLTVSRKAAMRIFDGGFNASNGGINYYGDIDPYFINRYGTDNQTLETLKGWIDDLVSANDGWMVWTRHNSNATSEDQTTAAQILSDAIDYALSLGVQIVTVERGLAEYLDIA